MPLYELDCCTLYPKIDLYIYVLLPICDYSLSSIPVAFESVPPSNALSLC